MLMPELLKDIDSLTAPHTIAKIKEAMQQTTKAEEYDRWLSPEGQEELKRMNNDRARQGLNIFDHAPTTKASL